jgi:hypothetical protein
MINYNNNHCINHVYRNVTRTVILDLIDSSHMRMVDTQLGNPSLSQTA